MEIPVVSRVYLTAAVLATAACALDLVSPFHLYFNLGGSYKGYETVTADCHPHGAVYRCHMWTLWSETGFTGEAKDSQKGRALDLKARSGRQ